MSETIPTEIRLACGCDVPYEIGQPIFNYYDRVAGEITKLATSSEPDTYGTDIKGMSFPDGKAWWTDTTAGFVDGSRMCCQAFAIDKGWHHAAQQSNNQEDNKESNMYNDTNELPLPHKAANDTINAQAAHIVELESEVAKTGFPEMVRLVKELEDRIDSDAAEITTLTNKLELETRAVEEYRSDVRSNVARIQEVLHSHARDCDDQQLIDMLIDQINMATRNGFPEISNCTRTYELTLTYVVEVQALSEEDARDNFIDGEYDGLIELSDYYELDVEEGC